MAEVISSKRISRRLTVAALGIVGAGVPFIAYASAGGLSSHDSGSDLPPVPDAAWHQVHDQAGIEQFAFDAEAPSLYRPDPNKVVNENTGKTISLDQAINSVTDATGLTIPPTAASLVSVTTHHYGYVSQAGDDRSVEPMYERAAVWAIELDQIEIPTAGEHDNAGEGVASKYTTSMIFMIDAYTGQFVTGAQYDPVPGR